MAIGPEVTMPASRLGLGRVAILAMLAGFVLVGVVMAIAYRWDFAADQRDRWESAAALRNLRFGRDAAEAVTFFVARATRPCFLRRNHGLVAHAT